MADGGSWQRELTTNKVRYVVCLLRAACCVLRAAALGPGWVSVAQSPLQMSPPPCAPPPRAQAVRSAQPKPNLGTWDLPGGRMSARISCCRRRGL
jgi:hypothetical protein